MSAYELAQLKELISQALLIIGLVVVVVAPWLIKAHERARIHDTLTKLLDRNATPPPELLKAITENSQKPPPTRPQTERDLRTGILWLSIAVGLGLLGLGLVLGHNPRHLDLPFERPSGALGLAAFPAAIGLGYIVLWFVGRRDR